MPKPPVDPGYFDKVNYVIDSWSRPCQAPWYIYIETVGPALLQAFIVLMTFGWDDVARGYFRPKGLRGKRHGRKGKRTGRLARFFPEIGEEVGKRMPGAKPIGAPQWTAAGRALWRIDSVMQRGLFWWLVADVTNDFAFEWTSLLYETVWCRTAHLGRFSAHAPGGGHAARWAWLPFNYTLVDYEQSPPIRQTSGGIAGAKGAKMACSGGITPLNPSSPPTSISFRVWDRTHGRVLASSPSQGSGDDDYGKMVFVADVPPGVEWVVQYYCAGNVGIKTAGASAGWENF